MMTLPWLITTETRNGNGERRVTSIAASERKQEKHSVTCLPSRPFRLFAALTVLLLILPLLPALPVAAASIPVTVNITRFVELVDEDPNDDQFCGDYYAAV